jgi:hypothetical protein
VADRTLDPVHCLTSAILAVCLTTVARPAMGQAFIPAAGDGTVSVSYQAVVARGQHSVLGESLEARTDDLTEAHDLIWYVEYGLSDRIAVHASLPYMAVRYEGPLPHLIGVKGQPSDLDDGTYHGSFQDFYFGTRFKLVESPRLALTPFVEAIVPSHHYESGGQSVVGRDLRALVVGAAVGGFADYLVPGLFFQTRISHAFVQKVVDVRPNRTGIDSAVGYFVTPRFAIQFIETLQVTHDGIDWLVPGGLALHSGATLTQDHRRNHDRLGRANALNLGAGVSFTLTEDVGVFGTVTKLAWGENLAPPRSVTVGMNWSFHTRRGATSAPSLAPGVRSRGGR